MSWILSLGYISKLQKLHISVIGITYSGIYVSFFFLTTILQNSSCEENHLSDSFPVSGLVPLFVLNWRAQRAAKQELYCWLISQKSSSEIRRFSDSCLFYVTEHFWNSHTCCSTSTSFLLPAIHLMEHCWPVADVLELAAAACTIHKECLLTLLTRYFN